VAEAPSPAPISASVDGLRGVVFNIQRFATSDGPGVRTTVFLKGCGNRCEWCHNPESISPRPELQICIDRCIGCGRCIAACSHHAHRLEDGVKSHDRSLCVACGECTEECFAGTLEMTGREMSVDEVMAEVLKDTPYYRHSEGGVTFSGGEPVLQRHFLRELLIACRGHELHTALDTAGNYPWSHLAELLPHLDLVMYDLKALDPAVHERYVGDDGARARQNLQELAATDCPLIVRTPVVGGVNDWEEEIEGLARLIGSFEHLLYYELLPFHPLGDAKRLGLGLSPDDQFHTPDKERMHQLAEVARQFVTQVRA